MGHLRWRYIAPLLIILGLRVWAAGWLAAYTPLWEGFDEINHYKYARFLALERRLPRPEDVPELPSWWQGLNQFNQPPLYYLMLAPPILAFDQGEMQAFYPNPQPICNLQIQQFFIHTPEEAFPGDGTVRAVWLGRLLSILMGVIATYFIWRTALLLWPDDRAAGWLAAGIFALMPGTAALSKWINNDTPLMMFGALALFWLVRCWKFPQHPRYWAGALIATLLCMATKLNGWAILPVFLAVLLARHRIGRRSQAFLIFLSSILIIGFIGLNQAQCGRPFCRLHRYSDNLQSPQDAWNRIAQTDYDVIYEELLETAFVPTINVTYPPPGMAVALGAMLAAGGLVGFSLYLRYRPHHRWLFVMLALPLISALILAHLRVWWLESDFMPVRYLAVGLPSLALMLAAGYRFLAGMLFRSLMAAPLLGFFLLTTLSPWWTLQPFFLPPPISDNLPASAIPVDIQFENGIFIAGYEVPAREEFISPVILYMGTAKRLQTPLFILVTGITPEGTIITECGVIAGSAMWSTLTWKPGTIIEQALPLQRLYAIETLRVEFFEIQVPYHLISRYDPAQPIQPLGTNTIILP